MLRCMKVAVQIIRGKKNDTSIRLYNMLFPIWLILFLPTKLWLLLIPANYLLDSIVLFFSLRDCPDRKKFCIKNTWKICLAGFLGDFVGSMFLGFCSQLGVSDDPMGDSVIRDALYAASYNPFYSIGSFVIVVIGIIIAGVTIYYLDKHILKKAGLEETQAKRSSLCMAIITAPYLYLIPSYLFW